MRSLPQLGKRPVRGQAGQFRGVGRRGSHRRRRGAQLVASSAGVMPRRGHRLPAHLRTGTASRQHPSDLPRCR